MVQLKSHAATIQIISTINRYSRLTIFEQKVIVTWLDQFPMLVRGVISFGFVLIVCAWRKKLFLALSPPLARGKIPLLPCHLCLCKGGSHEKKMVRLLMFSNVTIWHELNVKRETWCFCKMKEINNNISDLNLLPPNNSKDLKKFQGLY